MLAVTWGFSSICPRISPPGSRRVWKLMYDWPARMFGSWAARVVLLPSSRSHLLKIVPPTPLANGVTTTSLGLVSLNGRPKKPKRTPAFAPRGAGAWMWAASKSSPGSAVCVPVKSRPVTVTVNDKDVIALSRKNAA